MFFVSNTAIGESDNCVDRRLSTQSIEDVFPSSVLHEVDVLRRFDDHGSSTGNGDESIDRPHER